MATSLIDYQIAHLKKQLIKLELKKTSSNSGSLLPKQKTIERETTRFFICDEQEDFCLGSKNLLSQHLCSESCQVMWKTDS